MNGRQWQGVGLLIFGILGFVSAVLVAPDGNVPEWLKMALQIAGTVFPSAGLLLNLPSDTSKKGGA